jgi:SAM-dependent methyltransferase
MRTATDFNQFYAVPDPWQISRARFRDRVLRRIVSKFIKGKSVLELGCGEGHLTKSVFRRAKNITAVDFSAIAIERANANRLPNARFENANFLDVSFKGYDTIAAIECLYYLTPEEQESFFQKIANEHTGKYVILSGPIIGENEHRKYFTHEGLMETFSKHNFLVVQYRNLNVSPNGLFGRLVANFVKFPFFSWILNELPENMIYQRCYIIRMM